MDTNVKAGYTRVTEALNCISGYEFIDREILNRAAERGQRVHEYCDALIQKSEVKQAPLFSDDTIIPYVKSAQQWIQDFDPMGKPERFYCDEYMITGEADGLYHADGTGLVLFDFKTNYKESKTWPLQLSAYAYLARKSGFQIDAIEIVHLSKKGEYPRVLRYKEDFKTYLKCLDIHRYLNEKPGSRLADLKNEEAIVKYDSLFSNP